MAAGNAQTAQAAAVHLQVPIASKKWLPLDLDTEEFTSITQQVNEKRSEYKVALEALEKLRKAAGGEAEDSASLKAQAKRLQRRSNRMRAEIEASTQGTWKTFVDIQDVLIAFGALDPVELTPLPLGLVARGLQGQNELWLALALTHSEVRALHSQPSLTKSRSSPPLPLARHFYNGDLIWELPCLPAT